MTLYTPIYDQGTRTAALIEHAEQLKPFGARGKYCRYIPGVGFIGKIYDGDTLFYEGETVVKYWNKMPIKPEEIWRP